MRPCLKPTRTNPQTKAFEDKVGGRERIIDNGGLLPVFCVGKDREGKSALEVKYGPNITFQQNWELMTDGLSR